MKPVTAEQRYRAIIETAAARSGREVDGVFLIPEVAERIRQFLWTMSQENRHALLSVRIPHLVEIIDLAVATLDKAAGRDAHTLRKALKGLAPK